jgi:hypothetical protein
MKSPVAIVVAYRAELWTNAASIQLIPLWFILPLADRRVVEHGVPEFVRLHVKATHHLRSKSPSL